MLSLCASVRWSTRGVFVRCLRLILATVGLEDVSASLIITMIIHASLVSLELEISYKLLNYYETLNFQNLESC